MFRKHFQHCTDKDSELATFDSAVLALDLFTLLCGVFCLHLLSLGNERGIKVDNFSLNAIKIRYYYLKAL